MTIVSKYDSIPSCVSLFEADLVKYFFSQSESCLKSGSVDGVLIAVFNEFIQLADYLYCPK